MSIPIVAQVRPLAAGALVSLLAACTSVAPPPPAAPAAGSDAAAPATGAAPAAPAAGTPGPAAVAATFAARGVNLAGADFGETNLPGRFGADYVYPSAASVAYFQRKGMDFVRLPFRWERLQPQPNRPFDAAELARLQAFVGPVTAAGVTVMLDPHNYGRYYGSLIGSAAAPNAAYGDFWARLATLFKDNGRVVFGLMNEPHDMPTEQWLAAANTALAAIRASGAHNLVMVPGNAWTGAHSWNETWYGTPNGVAMKGVVDPGGNFIFEVHQYLDRDSSGTAGACVSPTIGVERLRDFTAWLQANGYRGFLGEFGGGANPTCNQALDAMLTFIEAHRDVWAGWSWWAAGPWWGSYFLSIEPSFGGDRPQMSVLAPHLR